MEVFRKETRSGNVTFQFHFFETLPLTYIYRMFVIQNVTNNDDVTVAVFFSEFCLGFFLHVFAYWIVIGFLSWMKARSFIHKR